MRRHQCVLIERARPAHDDTDATLPRCSGRAARRCDSGGDVASTAAWSSRLSVMKGGGWRLGAKGIGSSIEGVARKPWMGCMWSCRDSNQPDPEISIHRPNQSSFDWKLRGVTHLIFDVEGHEVAPLQPVVRLRGPSPAAAVAPRASARTGRAARGEGGRHLETRDGRSWLSCVWD